MLAVPLLTGCVGAAVVHNHEATEPNVALSTERARLVRYSSTEHVPVLEKSVLLQSWGKPDHIEVQGDKERWLYNDGLRWNGLFIFIGILPIPPIPIPFLLPVGHDYVAITFQGSTSVSIETKTEFGSGWGCFIISNVHSLEPDCLYSQPEEGKIDKQFFASEGDAKALGRVEEAGRKDVPDIAQP